MEDCRLYFLGWNAFTVVKNFFEQIGVFLQTYTHNFELLQQV